MQPPVLFLDLDGTLIGPTGDVHPDLWPDLDAAREAGVKMCVCTGRPSGGLASRIARRLGPELPHIYHGGAVVLTGGGAVIRAEAMPQAALRALVHKARAGGWTLELYTPEAIYVDRVTPMHARHLQLLDLDGRVCDLAELIETTPIVKAQWIIDDDALARRLADELPEGCFAARADSHSMSKACFVTLTRTGIHKGHAVRAVAEQLGVTLAECGAVGDSTGDLPMLDVVGHPYVMAEAPASMRARFKVLDSVRAHGVRAVLALA